VTGWYPCPANQGRDSSNEELRPLRLAEDTKGRDGHVAIPRSDRNGISDIMFSYQPVSIDLNSINVIRLNDRTGPHSRIVWSVALFSALCPTRDGDVLEPKNARVGARAGTALLDEV
jgi:hypothetical protein